jgi:hypothetical protein
LGKGNTAALTIGDETLIPPVLPKKPALPKAKTPPSLAINQ